VKHAKIMNTIESGNKVVENICEKNSWEKKFGLVHFRNEFGMISLYYLVYDKNIWEVNVGFDKWGYWMGDYTSPIEDLPKKYKEKNYPFLK
jgi:hypothetical protein